MLARYCKAKISTKDDYIHICSTHVNKLRLTEAMYQLQYAHLELPHRFEKQIDIHVMGWRSLGYILESEHGIRTRSAYTLASTLQTTRTHTHIYYTRMRLSACCLCGVLRCIVSFCLHDVQYVLACVWLRMFNTCVA